MQAHFIDPSEDSEENLHSFQGNEAGQDLDYEPGLEFDDTELAKAAIELHLANAAVATAGTPLSANSHHHQLHNSSNHSSHHLNNNNHNHNNSFTSHFYISSSEAGGTNYLLNQEIMAASNANGGGGGGGEDSLADCSLILEDGPLFSLDSQYESDGEDEATKCEAAPPAKSSPPQQQSSSSPNDSQSDSADLTTTTTTTMSSQQQPPPPPTRPTLENLVPRMTAVIEENSFGILQPLQPFSSQHQIDVSSIYLHSPEELLEENFEEALREQYLASLPPLDPALDLTTAQTVATATGGAEEENFEDIAEHGIVGVAGDDMFARKVITIYACRLPASKTFDYAKFLR